MPQLGTARGKAGVLAAALLIGGCTTRRLYEGPPLSAEQVAVIHVGDTIVREIDGQRRRGGAFDATGFEVAPGKHALKLVFEMPAHAIGIRTVPAQHGEGTCSIEFVARAGRQYWLGARAIGDDWRVGRWDGRWEAWIRDPSVSSEDDIVERCTSQAEPQAARAPAAESPVASELPGPAAADAPTPTPPAGPVPTAAAADTVAGGPSTDVIRLGTWNLKRLGQSPAKDLPRLAAAIDQSFDIVTVTEVMPANGGHPGYDRLMRSLGDHWGGLVTVAPRPHADAGVAEYYAIAYRHDRVRPCPGWSALRNAGEGSAPESGDIRFLHEPAFACFEAGGTPGSPGADFLLAAYHATWADGDAEAIAAEVSHIDDVFAAMQRARPGEADLIVAGDFHLESDELPLVTKAADRTRGDGSLLGLTGARRHNLYDHVLVHDGRATAEMVGDATVLDLRGLAASPADFVRTMSDHLPIMVRLRCTGPDDD